MNIEVSNETLKELEAAAKIKGITVEEAAVKILESYSERYASMVQKADDVAKKF